MKNLTKMQIQLLAMLVKAGGNVHWASLNPTEQRLATELEGQKLCYRWDRPGDAAPHSLYITDAGREAIAKREQAA